MIWAAYLGWARLDHALYGALPLIERARVFRATITTGIAVHYARPARRWFRQRLPTSNVFRRLERVSNRADGLCWYRAPDRESARHLADLQPDRNREGHAILREGELLLLDGRGQIQGFVIHGDNESIIQMHDGAEWAT